MYNSCCCVPFSIGISLRRCWTKRGSEKALKNRVHRGSICCSCLDTYSRLIFHFFSSSLLPFWTIAQNLQHVAGVPPPAKQSIRYANVPYQCCQNLCSQTWHTLGMVWLPIFRSHLPAPSSSYLLRGKEVISCHLPKLLLEIAFVLGPTTTSHIASKDIG